MSHLKRVQSFESLLKKKTKGFNSLSQFSRQDQSFLWVKIFVKQILWVMLKKWVQFCESCQKKGFNSVSYIQKKKKGSILWVVLEKGVQFCELYSKNLFLESFLLFFVQNILWVIFFLQKRSNSVSHNFWKVQNSFNHIEKKFNSLGHIQEKGSIHWDILKKKVQFFESSWKETILYFRIKRSSTLWVFSFDTRFNSLSHSSRKSSILRVIFDKIRSQFFESYSRNPVQFFSYWKEGFTSVSEKKGSILWVFFASKKNSILWVILKKRFNSLNHTQKDVQFYES